MNVQAFIDNISFPTTLVELEDFIDEFNVEQILTVDETEWTAPKWAVEGDIVFFFHAKTAIQRITKLETEMKKEKDIFDRIMEFPVLRIFNPFYKKNKEILLYLFFGGLTFLVSIISYAFLNIQIGWNALIANIGSWILAVSFAYVTNRVWVFDSNAETTADFIKEITSFIGGRVATLVIEELILFIFITNLGMNSMLVKIVAQVIVIVLNYVISKLIVFKK